MKRFLRRTQLLALLTAVMLLVSGCAVLDSFKYKKAVEQFEQGNYYQAQTLFAEIADYEDATKHIAYISAAKLADAGSHKEASAGFDALGDFRDSLTLSVYHAARQAEQEERYEDAQPLYQQISAYGDSSARLAALPQLISSRDERLNAEKYQQAQQVLNNGEYQQAQNLFAEIEDYRDSAKYLSYISAVKLAAAGNHRDAAAGFDALGDFRDSLTLSVFHAARLAEQEERYEDARELYRQISYGDSAERLAALPHLIRSRDELRRDENYSLAQDLLNNGEYQQAIELFTQLNGYEDSTKYLMYARAIQLAEEEGEYSLAINSFASLDDFRDSSLQMAYYRARQAEAELSHEEAGDLYRAIPTFRDSAERMANQPNLALDRDFAALLAVAMEEQDYPDAYEISYEKYDDFWDEDDMLVLFNSKYTDSDTRMYENFYLLGEKALEMKQYKAAESIFSWLEEVAYRDADVRVNDCILAWCQQMMDAGRYRGVTYDLEELVDKGYAAAIEPLNECYYQMGLEDEKKLDYSAAFYHYLLAGQHKDSADRAARFENEYAAAEAMLAEGNYTGAAETFAALYNYRKAAERVPAIHYQHGEALLNSGEWDAAVDAFTLAGGYEDAAQRIGETYYAKGEKMLEEGKSNEAITAFTYAGKYKDAAQRILKVHYDLAEQALAEGKYEMASAKFKAAQNYSDAAHRVNEPYYAKAEKLLAEGKYYEAIESFARAGEYSNAAERILMIRYDLAEQALAAGEYNEAVTQFKAAKNYSDAARRVNEPYYVKAEKMLAEGNYIGALSAFESAKDFSDAQTRVLMIHYTLAERALAAGEYSEASAHFKAAKTYSDAAQRINEPYYVKAEKLMAEGKYAEASGVFQSIGEFDRINEPYYVKAEKLMAEGRYAEASEVFKAIGDHVRVNEPFYLQAEKLLTEGKYDEAIEAFGKAADYANAAQRVLETYYAKGEALLAQGNTGEAINAFTHAQNHADAAERVKMIHYTLAEQALTEGKYDTASVQFAAAGSYKDAVERVLATYYAKGEALLAQGNTGEAINAFTHAKNHADAAERVLMIHYTLAEQALKEGQYDTASAEFKNAKTYLDAAQRVNEPYYVKAEKLLAEGKYTDAYSLFDTISNYKDSAERILQSKLNRAVTYIENKLYKHACPLLQELGEYRDSAKLKAAAELYCIANAQKGDTVLFGKNEWIVINKSGTKAFLLSTSAQSTSFKGNVWETSDTRTNLNGRFIEHNFSSVEQQCVVTTKVSNVKNKAGKGGSTTNDKVFIFNESEAKQYASYISTVISSGKIYLRTPAAGDYALRVAQASASNDVTFRSSMTIGEIVNILPVMWVDTNVLPYEELLENAQFNESSQPAQQAEPTVAIQPAETASASFPSDLQVGDEVVFGHYEQDGDLDNGMEEIEWQVLDKKDGKALLISKYALEKLAYDWNEKNTVTDATWETCRLRRWLNNDFLNEAFDAQEQALIVETLVTADKNPSRHMNTDQGNDTVDKVFLLSIGEAERYFSTKAEARCIPTDYVIKHKANKLWPHKDLGTCSWMLRTLGSTKHAQGYVDTLGGIYHSMERSAIGIRPAMWISIGPAAADAAVKQDQPPKPAETASASFSSDLQVGDEVLFGHYEQDGNLDNGMEEIEWLVLAREDDRALLISKYVLDYQPFYQSEKKTYSITATWETSSIRPWLNNHFLNSAFNTQEQALIADTLVTADRSVRFATPAGNDTIDKVFLLSGVERKNFFC